MSYSKRLDIIYDKLNSEKDEYKIKLGEVSITDKKFFKNAKQILKPFKRPPDHIINFIGSLINFGNGIILNQYSTV